MYDGSLGRWNGVDALAEKYSSISPFVYVANNPISAIDIDGRRIYWIGGAGNDPGGWNYDFRWQRAFYDSGVKYFKELERAYHRWKLSDIRFTNSYRESPYNRFLSPTGIVLVTKPKRATVINRAVNDIVEDVKKNPLLEGEQLNLIGYSYGSVVHAHAALELARKGIFIRLNASKQLLHLQDGFD